MPFMAQTVQRIPNHVMCTSKKGNKMSLSTAIKTKNLELLEKTVAKAVKIYDADKPAEVVVDTAFGSLPFSSLWDDDTKWAVITAAYATILQEVATIPAKADAKVETAKIIATNAVMRNVSSTTPASDDGLI